MSDPSSDTSTDVSDYQSIVEESRAIRKEVAELKRQMKHMRTIVTSTDKTPYKVSERLVDRGYISQEVMHKIFKQYLVINNGSRCLLSHPSFPKMRYMLQNLSKKMSNKKKQIDKEAPSILSTNRTNIYYASDYIRFGDNVIDTFMAEHPIDDWGIDWDWVLCS